MKLKTLILFACLICLQFAVFPKPVDTSNHTYEEIYIEASRWKWDFYYENGTMTTNYLELYEGVPYTLTATSIGGNHVLRITTGLQDISIAAQLGSNSSVDVTFNAGEPITASCNQTCGIGHDTMSANFALVKGGLIIITIVPTVTETVGGSGSTNITQTAFATSIINQTIETTSTEIERNTSETTVISTKTTPFLYFNSVIIFILLIKLIHGKLFSGFDSFNKLKPY